MNISIFPVIDELVQYGFSTGLLSSEEDGIYARNRILMTLHLDYYEHTSAKADEMMTQASRSLELILKDLLDYAANQGLLPDNTIGYRDLFDTKLMDCLMPRPSEVTAAFQQRYSESPEKATDYFYKLSQDSDYIRRYRVCKDIRWKTPSCYGDIDISINLSKPEKDPKAIAAAKNASADKYPKCLLCKENVGYAGRIDHPARQNHRIIPLTIAGNQWGLQYSPYVYYNEHCILFNYDHTPMKIEQATFEKLLGFVEQFPHYFLGSNADLPIVGGSILSHDHYQGGHYTFAMERAPYEKTFTIQGFEDIETGIVKWPMSVIRIRHKDKNRLVALATHILNQWRGYTDESAKVYAETDGEPHNTITPIARMRDDAYELDLVLRNNYTSKEYPLGLYHPHDEYHHIKKENIGLIEVMGLAILPARLQEEMQNLANCILAGNDPAEDSSLEKHAAWAKEFLPHYMRNGVSSITRENVMDILKSEIGKVFVHVLEDAGVYKCTPDGRTAFMRFIKAL